MYPYNGVSGSANWTVSPVISQDGEPWQSGNPSAPADGTYLSWIKAILDRLQNLKAIAGLLGSNNIWTGSNSFLPTAGGRAITFGATLDEVACLTTMHLAAVTNVTGTGALHVKSGGQVVVEDGGSLITNAPFLRIGDDAATTDRVQPVGSGAPAHVGTTGDVWELQADPAGPQTVRVDAPAVPGRPWRLTITRNASNIHEQDVTIKDDATGNTLCIFPGYSIQVQDVSALANPAATVLAIRYYFQWVDLRWSTSLNSWKVVRASWGATF